MTPVSSLKDRRIVPLQVLARRVLQLLLGGAPNVGFFTPRAAQ